VLAKKLKLKQVVYHSVFRAEHFRMCLTLRPNHDRKRYQTFDVPFTSFVQLLFPERRVPEGRYDECWHLSYATWRACVSAVDIRDIAEVSAIRADNGWHLGKTYNLNGPEVLSGRRWRPIWSGARQDDLLPGEDMDGFEAQFRQHSPAWSRLTCA